MFNIVLHEPEIPPNTGNIIRLSANTGATIHLIHPLGFSMDEPQLRRAGLDYWEHSRVVEHLDFDSYLRSAQPGRLYAMSGHGTSRHADIEFRPGDTFLFGKESDGLPSEVMAHEAVTAVLRIPMLPERRSLNLSNSVAIILFEAWRQVGFEGAV
jgi:tRNA (cytidine/uridine-2'-O-)-methyltransferase